MKRILFSMFFMSMLSALFSYSHANNVRISDITLTNDSTLTFAISWDNSWRNVHAPGNHDAVWLFIKRKGCASLKWEHTDLSANMNDHTGSGLLEVFVDGKDLGPNAKGVFIRRKTHGSGNIVNQTVSIRLTGVANGEFDFKVFGIEMVQIPEGEFYLGDGNSTNTPYSFKHGSTVNPFLVTSEDIEVNATTGLYSHGSSAYTPKELNPKFPKGYNEIYCMKYEISHGQYVEFLNSILSDQAAARAYLTTASRNNVQGTWPNFTTTVPHRAKGFIGWADLCAYLDWSALRPMTELEFEKICRGPVEPVAGDYAWGTTTVTNVMTMINDGTPTESCSNPIDVGSGIANYYDVGIVGPVRCGYAAKPTTDRLTAGATYYGVMEMSGNIVEHVVSTGHVTGAAYTGLVGDGEISSSPGPGFSNVPNWPSQTVNGDNAYGHGTRGGGAAYVMICLRISDRTYAANTSGGRYYYMGGRGVR